MSKFVKSMIFASAAAFLLTAGYSAPVVAQDAMQTKRLALMKDNGKSLRAAMGGDKAAAATIAANAKMLSDASFWAKGSGPGTRAKAEVFSDFADFKAKMVAMQTAAEAAAAGTGEPAAVRATCGGCHKLYRGPELK
ncbi:MAG: cytochrome c [Proteobacteria bacterium]|nr:cytochrome c [Pseudomonadota bacterium]